MGAWVQCWLTVLYAEGANSERRRGARVCMTRKEIRYAHQRRERQREEAGSCSRTSGDGGNHAKRRCKPSICGEARPKKRTGVVSCIMLREPEEVSQCAGARGKHTSPWLLSQA